MNKDKKEKTQEKATNKYGEEIKKNYHPVKKILVIMSIALAAIVGLFAIAAIIAFASGTWSTKKIQITSLSFQTEFDGDGTSSDKVNVTDDFKIKLNYLPEKANVLDVELKFVNGIGSNVIEFPEKVKAGQDITIKVKKGENGTPIGGEALIEASTGLVKTSNNLKIFVDVPISPEGLKLVSNFDGKELTTGSQNIKFYVFTDPKGAINPNTGEVPDLTKAFKNITLISGNTNALTINGAGVPKSNLFYCPDYLEHKHDEPFLTTKIHTVNGVSFDLGQPTKCVEFSASTTGTVNVPIVITAKALRTYSMEADYVSINDTKYITAEGINRQQFFNDLSDYVQKYASYITKDTRSFTYQNYVCENGTDYINKITRELNGQKYIKINDSNPEYEAALFYLFVNVRKTFNIEKIEIDKVKTSVNNEPISFQLHDKTTQLTFNEFKRLFGLSLVPTNTVDFTSSDLDPRIRELKIITVMDKGNNSTSEFEKIEIINNAFIIENPVDTINPVWKLTCVNPFNATERSKNARLRVYLPNNATGAYNDKCLWVDIPLVINENGISKFNFKPNHGIIQTMVVNNKTIAEKVHKQELSSSAYDLLGFNGQIPTYTTVKWFAEVNSAKTLGTDGVTRSDFFKIRLTNTGNPKAYQMPLGESEIVSGYEIAYSESGKIMLEALNASNVYAANDPLRIFAAVIKTNYDGYAVDANGNPQYVYDRTSQQMVLNEAFTNYVLVQKTESYIEIVTEYFLENLNIYTMTEGNEGLEYSLRNIGAGNTEDLRIKLLAGNSYTLYASGYKLKNDGSIDTGVYTNTNGIDHISNIKYAMTHAQNNKTDSVKFRLDNRQDKRQYVSLTTRDSFTVDSETGLWKIELDALVDKTASNDNTGAFDLSAYGVGLLDGVFKQAESTVNMKVNYATISSFDLKTNFTKTNTVNGNSFVYNNNFTIRPQITSTSGIEWRASVVDDGVTIDEEKAFAFELEYSNDLINSDGAFNADKIDKYLSSDQYVDDYIKKVFNPENDAFIGVNWFVHFEDGTTRGIEDYIEVKHEVATETITLEGGETQTIKYFKPIINILGGEPTGVNIVIDCTIGLYKTNNSYIQTKLSTLNLKIVQSKELYELYSEKMYNGNKILVANGIGEQNALVINGGENVDLLEDLTPTNDSGLPVYKAGKNGAYVPYPSADNQDYRKYRIIANLDTDNKLAGYCKYSIADYKIQSVPVYFKDSSGKKVYELVIPSDVEGDTSGTKQLILYSEFITTDTEARITVTSPFKNGASATYHVLVKSAVTLSGPAVNLSTKTTNPNDGKVDLAASFGAKQKVNGVPTTDLLVGFSVIKNAAFGRLEEGSDAPIKVKDKDGNITTKKLFTAFYPANVYNSEIVELKMFYYISNNDADSTFSEYEVKSIKDNTPIAIEVTKGYEIELNMGTSVVEISGDLDNDRKGVDLFGKYGGNPDSFIKFKNLATDTYVDASSTIGLLRSLIRFEYDESKITDIQLFNLLFNDNEQKATINNGMLKTLSISSNFELPIIVKFKAGFGGTSVQSISDSSVFTITLNAALNYTVNGNNVENKAYDTAEHDGITDGHTFTKVNTGINTTNNQYVITTQNQPLYTYGSVNNIISLTGGANEDLLTSKFASIKALKFDENQEQYVEYNLSDEFAKFSITKNIEGGLLKNLTLVIKNAVNTTEHFKLEITTTYADFNDIVDQRGNKFEYFFTLSPTIKAVATYPIESEGKERVKVDSKINLLDNYINEINRLRLFDGVNNFYQIVKPTASENRYAIVKNSVINFLPEGTLPFSFKVISGPARVNGNIIEFVTPTSSFDVVVRCIAFNGVTVDYKFEVFTGTSAVVITPKFSEIYAENQTPYNLFSDNFLSISNEPSGIEYVVKYQTVAEELYVGSTKETKTRVTSTNQVLPYTTLAGLKTLNMWFDDVTDTNGVTVTFLIWHNYNVNGDAPVTLTVTLKPNLILQKNDKLNVFAAGIETDVLSNCKGDNVFIKLGNNLASDLANINLAVSQIKTAEDGAFRAVTDADLTKYGFEIKTVLNSDGTQKTYSLKTLNISNEIEIKFKVYKAAYYYEFEAKLKPNINFNIKYLDGENTDSNFYVIKGAASSNGSRGVTLNKFIFPKTLSGEVLKAEPGKIGFGFKFYTKNASGDMVAADSSIVTTPIVQNKEDRMEFSLTVKPVNKEYIVFGELSITWNGTVTYTEIVNLRIVPNLTESPVTYSQNGVKYLEVYAGSEIAIDFTKDNGNARKIRIQQGVGTAAKYAEINATQINTDKNTENVMVVLKSASGENYTLSSAGNKLIIGKYLNDAQIDFEIYYDLTGALYGVKDPAAGDGAPFNTLKKSEYKLTIRIVPSLNSIVYSPTYLSDSGSETPRLAHNTSENAYDLTTSYSNLINASTDPYEGKDTKANEIKLTKVFKIDPKDNLTFNASDTTKVFVKKQVLLDNINYSVKAKSGKTFEELTTEIEAVKAKNSVKFDVRAVGSTYELYAIFTIPNNVSDILAFEFQITITLPGVSGTNSTAEIYVKLGINNSKFGQIITPKPTQVGVKETTIGWNDRNNSDNVAINAISSDNRVLLTGHYIDSVSGRKNGLFQYGYLVGTVTAKGAGLENKYDSTSNIYTLKRDTQEYYVYVLNNVHFTAAIEGVVEFATIVNENGRIFLEVKPYYATNINATKRRLTVQISCGTITEVFNIIINPIIVEYSSTYETSGDQIIFDNKLVDNDGKEIVATDKEITLITTNLSDANKAIVNSWLVKTGMEYKIVPNRYQISEPVTFSVLTKVTTGVKNSTDSQDFSEIISDITIEPIINFSQELMEITPNSSGTEKTLTIVGTEKIVEEKQNLIYSEIFTNSSISDVSVTLTPTNTQVNYGDYITLNVTPVSGVYTLTIGSTINVISQNLLNDGILKFKAVATFKAEGVLYSYEKEIVLNVIKNAGISNLKASYYATLMIGSNKAKVILENTKITGAGRFDYDVANVACDSSGLGTITNTQVAITPQFNTTDSSIIDSLTIDWSQLMSDYESSGISNVRGITINIFYVDGGNKIPVRSGIIINIPQS